MEVNRAQEILRGDAKINVEHNGVSVWIDSVDSGQETAKVHAEAQPSDTRIVSVEELQEVQ